MLPAASAERGPGCGAISTVSLTGSDSIERIRFLGLQAYVRTVRAFFARQYSAKRASRLLRVQDSKH